MIHAIRSAGGVKVRPSYHKLALWGLLILLACAMAVGNRDLRLSDYANQRVLGALTSSSATLLTDANGEITFCSPEALRLLGGEFFPQVAGHNVTEWMSPDLADRHVKHFEDARRLPMGTEIPLHSSLFVGGVEKPVTVTIEAGESDGQRVYRVEFSEGINQ